MEDIKIVSARLVVGTPCCLPALHSQQRPERVGFALIPTGAKIFTTKNSQFTNKIMLLFRDHRH